MSDAVLLIMLCSSGLLGVLIGVQIGAARFRRRMWEIARHAPGTSVAMATLERAMRIDRDRDRLEL